jgi:glutaconate CoA-transferase, subunit A
MSSQDGVRDPHSRSASVSCGYLPGVPRPAARILPLADAVAELVHDGDTVALEGFTHLIPVAAGQEIIRQGRRELTVVRMTPDIIYDQLIGAGCVRRLVFSWGGNPGVGSLHRFRAAVQSGTIELEEHSHAGLANMFVAGASHLPFAVLRGYAGTDLPAQTDRIKPITCPFTGETLTALAAVNPDVSVIHAQQADRDGNVMLWGMTGVQKEAVLAAERSLVTVEEIVDELVPRPNAVVLPRWVVTAVSAVPGGAKPSYAQDYYDRDNDAYRAWDAISKDPDRFREWLDGLHA